MSDPTKPYESHLSLSDIHDSILDLHPDIICRHDVSHKIVYLNLAAAEFLGQDRDLLIDGNLKEVFPRQHTKTFETILARIDADEPRITGVLHFKDHPTHEHVLWTTIGLFEDEILVGYQTVGRDISARHKLNRELEEKTQSLLHAQSQLRTVIDAVPSLIWYKDEHNNILQLNEAAAQSINMRVDQVQGQNTYDLFGDAAKSYHEVDLNVIQSGVALRDEIELYAPNDQDPRWVQTDKIPISDDPDGPRVLVVSTDISKLKSQEELLKSINKNLDEFASMASHDLQAPLRKIAITAELMQMELGKDLPDCLLPYLNDITDGVQSMRDQIRSFLNFMRSSPDGIDLNSVNITEVIQQTADLLKEDFEDAKARLDLPDKPVFVRGDAILLGQVFQNLMSNAIKYRSEDRPLELKVGIESNNSYWSITVMDNGIGVHPHSTHQIFDVFGRAEPEGTVEGSGIGLALCRRILSFHGGTIELLDTEHPGSQFLIQLHKASETPA